MTKLGCVITRFIRVIFDRLEIPRTSRGKTVQVRDTPDEPGYDITDERYPGQAGE